MKKEKKEPEKRKVGTSVKDKLLVETRRNQIIQAANKMFAQKGFHQTTIKDICEASGLARERSIITSTKKKISFIL